jgi:hypothetical protein
MPVMATPKPLSGDWLSNLRMTRQQLRHDAAQLGIRATSRRAGCTAMKVSRFVDGSGSEDARDLFQIADALGYHFILVKNPARQARS